MFQTLCLCANRHDLGFEIESIFDIAIEDIFDFKTHRQVIAEKLTGVTELYLYVTGITPVLVEVIKHCYKNNINLVLLHYNKQDKTRFVPQIVFQF